METIYIKGLIFQRSRTVYCDLVLGSWYDVVVRATPHVNRYFFKHAHTDLIPLFVQDQMDENCFTILF